MINPSNAPVAVLFSGGDAPGMNAFLRASVRLGLNRHQTPVIGVRSGYRGLCRAADQVNGQDAELEKLLAEMAQNPGLQGLIRPKQYLIQMDHAVVSGIVGKGGTLLGTARCLEFLEPAVRQKVIGLLKKIGIRALIVVGGDGSLAGGECLARECDIPIIGVPATIDNDLLFTEMSLGVDTAVHSLVWAVDRFIDTARSHRRVMILETMGRASGDLARMAALASGAEMVVTPDGGPLTQERMIYLADLIEGSMTRGRGHAIVLIAEGVETDPPQKRNRAYVLSDAFQSHFQRPGAPFPDLEVRPSVLGHLQRGGHTTPQDCILAARFAERAWEEIMKEQPSSGITALRNNQVEIVPFGAPPMPQRKENSLGMEHLHADLAHW